MKVLDTIARLCIAALFLPPKSFLPNGLGRKVASFSSLYADLSSLRPERSPNNPLSPPLDDGFLFGAVSDFFPNLLSPMHICASIKSYPPSESSFSASSQPLRRLMDKGGHLLLSWTLLRTLIPFFSALFGLDVQSKSPDRRPAHEGRPTLSVTEKILSPVRHLFPSSGRMTVGDPVAGARGSGSSSQERLFLRYRLFPINPCSHMTTLAPRTPRSSSAPPSR